jgi:hypothetical protein
VFDEDGKRIDQVRSSSDTQHVIASKRAFLTSLVLAGLILAGCSTSHFVASSRGSTHHHAPTPTTTSSTPPATQPKASNAPTALAADYADTTSGPGYALIVNPGPAGSGILGGLAVYQYQDGREAAYFSFYGRAVSTAPFQVAIKGEMQTATATFQVAPTGSSITVENCAQLFSPVVGVLALSAPPAPASCTFSYNLAPQSPRTQPAVATDLLATSTIKSDLVNAYLLEYGWQAQYSSDITLKPGSTYVGYDPQTGLDWAFASFVYSGPSASATGSPGIVMQDGGDTGLFFQIPIQNALPSYDGWTMVGLVVIPGCYSQTTLPSSLMHLWNLADSPACTGQG